MTASNSSAAKLEHYFVDHDLILERTLSAPRGVVFAAWLDPAQMSQWFGPNGFTIPLCELEPRPGGAIKITMRGPDGVDYPFHGSFIEIDRPQRLVFETFIEDDAGDVMLHARNTVTFDDVGEHTRLVFRGHVLRATAAAETALDGVEEGWNQTLDRLVAFVCGN
jgi:uncharacterized protein YndB with AHSA1/START domain